MGGCKCSYRNCTVKSDGKTHLFHYPVFDKVRCHKWLTNSHRLDYFNLKVKQLRNRVVCQHHFTDDNFMNFKKDKLTRSAVPTEDGPFCDSDKIPLKMKREAVSYPITIDDIENDIYTTNERRSVSTGMKYGDYLTNGELSDLDYLNPTIPDNNSHVKNENSNELKDFDSINPIDKSALKSSKKTFTRKFQTQPISIVQPFSDCNNLNITTTPIVFDNLPISYEQVQSAQLTESTQQIQPLQSVQDIRFVQPIEPVQSVQITEIPQSVQPIQSLQSVQDIQPAEMAQSVQLVQPTQSIQPLQIQVPNVGINQLTPQVKTRHDGNMLKKSKIKILSEKKICEPVTVVGKLDSVSPDIVLQLPNRSMKTINNNENNAQIITYTQLKDEKEPIQSIVDNNVSEIIEQTTQKSKDQILQTVFGNISASKDAHEQIIGKNTTSPSKFHNNVSNKTKKASSPISLIKNKISPERAANIEKKRKFNMKLKDILSDGLNSLNNKNKIIDEKLLEMQLKSINEKSNMKTRVEVSTDLESQQSMSDFLEVRLRKMEDTLMDKIEQNSRRIMELKNCMSHSKKSYSVSTQTHVNEESYKKFLYHEISNFMSPDVKSAVYEELFINKYAQSFSKDSNIEPKRRKRR